MILDRMTTENRKGITVIEVALDDGGNFWKYTKPKNKKLTPDEKTAQLIRWYKTCGGSKIDVYLAEFSHADVTMIEFPENEEDVAEAFMDAVRRIYAGEKFRTVFNTNK